MARSDPKPILTPRQVVVLETLMDRANGETLEQVATRAGVSRRTLHRYLHDAVFHAEFRARVYLEFGGQRGRVARALVEGASTPGPGQSSMQKIYWQMLGELREQVELSVPDGPPIAAIELPVSVDQLSIGLRQRLVAELEAIERGAVRCARSDKGESRS